MLHFDRRAIFATPPDGRNLENKAERNRGSKGKIGIGRAGLRRPLDAARVSQNPFIIETQAVEGIIAKNNEHQDIPIMIIIICQYGCITKEF